MAQPTLPASECTGEILWRDDYIAVAISALLLKADMCGAIADVR